MWDFLNPHECIFWLECFYRYLFLLARHAYSLKHLVVTGFLQKLKILFFLPVRSSETAGRYISYRLVVWSGSVHSLLFFQFFFSFFKICICTCCFSDIKKISGIKWQGSSLRIFLTWKVSIVKFKLFLYNLMFGVLF